MATILMLVHRIPCPPDKGDKIRSFHLVKHLASRHRLHLGYFIDDPADCTHEAMLRRICASVHGILINPARSRILSARGLLDGAPLSVAYYRNSAMREWVRRIIGEARPDLLFGFSSSIGEYLMEPAETIPLVMDFCDVDSEKWRHYARESRFPMNLVYQREARCLLSFERALASRSVASLFATEDEAALFRALAPEAASRTDALNNGVDHRAFDPDRPWPRAIPEGGPVAIFTGAMDYRPNADAALWFAEAVWPKVRQHVRNARFFIVGGRPLPAVKALNGLDGITVTGRVPDIQPYLAWADCVVAPLRIARGVQNKILEGMAMAKPVVATPQGFEGIRAEPGRDLLVKADADGFAAAVAGLMLDGDVEGIGPAARRRILEYYGWNRTFEKLDTKLAAAIERKRL